MCPLITLHYIHYVIGQCSDSSQGFTDIKGPKLPHNVTNYRHSIQISYWRLSADVICYCQ